MAGANAEPSMEDILSSIKRIIAEDSEAVMATPRAKRAVGLSPMTVAPEPDNEEPDVLELTEEVEPPPPALEPSPAPQPASKIERAPVPEQGSETVATTTEHVDAPPVSEAKVEKPVLVSPQTAEASRSSLAALSALVVKPDVAGSDTLEGMVREMLRPMLTEWLDAKLPDLVERMVAQEITRITARG